MQHSPIRVPANTPQDWEREGFLIKTAIFFLHPDNWNPQPIKEILLPSLLEQSETFKGGKEIDLTKFSNISIKHLQTLSQVFPRLQRIILRTGPKNLLSYLTHLEFLDYINITLEKNCQLNIANISLPIQKIKIRADKHIFTIQDLLQCTPQLQKFTLIGGTVTQYTTTLLTQFDLSAISLTNIQLDEQGVEPTMNLIVKPNVVSLKIILTNHKKYNAGFNRVANLFLAQIDPTSALESLTFTLNQNYRQKISNILHLAHLKNLRIYFTAQNSIARLFELINLFLAKPNLDITFIEYYDYPSCPIGPEYVRAVLDRSRQARAIIEAAELSAKVISIDHFGHFPHTF